VRVDLGGPVISSNASALYEGPATVTMTVTDAGSGVREVQYLDGSTWVVIGGPWVFADTAVGAYSRTFRAFDNVGNQSDYTMTYSIRSASVPETTMTVSPSPNAAGWVRADASVLLAATDTAGGLPGSGVAATYYTLNGGSRQTYGAAPFAVTAEGATSVEYWSVDAVGNTESPKTGTVRIDKTPPVFSDDRSALYESTATVTMAVSDTGSGLRDVQYFDGSSWVATSGPWVFVDGAGGDYSRAFRAFDIAGNQSDYTLAYSIRLPGSPSTTLTVSPPPNAAGWTNADAMVSLDATISGGGSSDSHVAFTYYTLNGGARQTYPGAPFVVSDEGTTTIHYWSVDASGNAEPARSATIRLDKTAPTLSDDRVTQYLTTVATITVTAVDRGSGIVALDYSIDGGATQTIPASSVTTLTAAIP
jgi:hypothetical protein